MRVDFVKALESVMESDSRSVFVTGDLGYGALEGLAAKYGKRFLNAGVAEQNMIGAAAGMALTGLHPWVYSIAPFATYRCFEQIRNDVCLHRLPVRVVGNGGGYTYGIMGSTHHALEDLGALKTLPNLRLYFPCSNNHVAAAVSQLRNFDGPAYLRLAISGFPNNEVASSESSETLTRRYFSSKSAPSSSTGRAPSVTIVGIGHATQIILTAMKSASESGVFDFSNCDIFGIARFPFDLKSDQELVASVGQSRRLVILDEHYLSGSIAESLAVALGIPETHLLTARYLPEQGYGSSQFHLKQSGLTPEALIQLLNTLPQRGSL